MTTVLKQFGSARSERTRGVGSCRDTRGRRAGGIDMRCIDIRFSVLLAVLLSLTRAGTAEASDPVLVGFDDGPAVAANGPIPGTGSVPEITPLQACGSNTKSYLAEL